MLNKKSTVVDKPIGIQEYIGWSVWAFGMFFEVVADFQKSSFKAIPENKVIDSLSICIGNQNNSLFCFPLQDKFITSGLWSISRHPNYFGEIVLWFGLYISSSATFKGTEYLSVLSPGGFLAN